MELDLVCNVARRQERAKGSRVDHKPFQLSHVHHVCPFGK